MLELRKLFGTLLCKIGLHDWEYGYRDHDWLVRKGYAKEEDIRKFDAWDKVQGCSRCQKTKKMSDASSWMPWSA